MAESFNGSVKINVQGTLTSDIDIGTRSHAISYSKSYALTNGSGANQANMIWVDTRTLAASTAEDLDLVGVLTNAFGTVLSFSKIKGIIISAASANTNNVLVGGDGSAAFVNWVSDATDVLIVRPGGTLCLMAPDSAGYAVTATTADLLQIANSSSGTSVTYDIILIGAV